MPLKIHHKLTLLFGLIIAINLVGLYIYLNGNVRADTYQRIESLLYKQTLLSRSYVEKYLETAPVTPDWDSVADLIGNDLGVRVTIIAKDGVVLGDSTLSPQAVRTLENHATRPEIQMAMEKGEGSSVRYSSTKKVETIYHAVKFDQGLNTGFIRLAMQQPDVELDAQRLKGVVAVSLLFVFVISLLLSFVTSFSFSKPILEIAKVADKIARGDFSEKIHLPRKDVIGHLAETLNQMADQVRTRMEEVQLGRSRLEAVLSSMVEGVLVIERQDKILFMNDSLKHLLEIETDPIGKSAMSVIRHINIREILTQANRLKDGMVASEITFLFPVEKNILVHAAPVIFQGKPQGVVLVFHNITELKRLEKIRQEFVANVSHELRTPIASIKGYAETLLSGALDDKENARDFVNIIHTDAERLARLIEDILDLSRVESGKLNMAFKSCDLYSLAERSLAGFSKPTIEKKISLLNNIPRDLPKVFADDDRLAQVFLNLIDNAVKFTSAGGSIIITAEEKGRFIQVNVQDNGIGIPPEDQARVFERFYRVDKARSRELGGTGLGLSIVKHIIQAHKGEVFVRSEVNKGSVFSFTLLKAA